MWLRIHRSQRKTVGQRRGIINHVVRLFEESRKLCLRKWESVGRRRSLWIEESQFVRFQLNWSVSFRGIQFASASSEGTQIGFWLMTQPLLTNSSLTSSEIFFARRQCSEIWITKRFLDFFKVFEMLGCHEVVSQPLSDEVWVSTPVRGSEIMKNGFSAHGGLWFTHLTRSLAVNQVSEQSISENLLLPVYWKILFFFYFLFSMISVP